MNGWHPIETAPMKETILVWLPAQDSDGEIIAVWPAVLFPPDEFDDEPAVWVSIASWDEREIGWSVTSPKPTHWMPLPAPPQ